MSVREFNRLAKRLGSRRSGRSLLRTALTHSSWINENPDESDSDNENLEFLGDAVLDLVVSHQLYCRFPDLSPGAYTKLRANVVNGKVLAGKAREIGIGDHIRLGRGEEQTNGRDKDSVLANALEAVIGARFLASGYRAAERLVLHLFDSEIETVGQSGSSPTDHKSMLQHHTQELYGEIPRYKVVRATGPDHDRCFEIEVRIQGEVLGYGTGKSKKEAEQAAAAMAFASIE